MLVARRRESNPLFPAVRGGRPRLHGRAYAGALLACQRPRRLPCAPMLIADGPPPVTGASAASSSRPGAPVPRGLRHSAARQEERRGERCARRGRVRTPGAPGTWPRTRGRPWRRRRARGTRRREGSRVRRGRTPVATRHGRLGARANRSPTDCDARCSTVSASKTTGGASGTGPPFRLEPVHRLSRHQLSGAAQRCGWRKPSLLQPAIDGSDGHVELAGSLSDGVGRNLSLDYRMVYVAHADSIAAIDEEVNVLRENISS